MTNKKELWVAYILLVFGGLFGIHQFYANKVKKGIIYIIATLVSFGLLTILFCLADLFFLPAIIEAANKRIEKGQSHD